MPENRMQPDDGTGSRRILVVDDNPAIHGDFRKILGRGTARSTVLAAGAAAVFGTATSAAVLPAFHLESAFQGEEALHKVRRSLQDREPYAMAFDLRTLRDAGIRIAIDDFGTGDSSLSRLSRLPVDTLKIDGSFTAGLPRDDSSRALVSMIIGLARTFGMSTVAEGVETAEQLQSLRQMKCDHSQGFLHSRPVSRMELGELVKRHRDRFRTETESGHQHKIYG